MFKGHFQFTCCLKINNIRKCWQFSYESWWKATLLTKHFASTNSNSGFAYLQDHWTNVFGRKCIVGRCFRLIIQKKLSINNDCNSTAILNDTVSLSHSSTGSDHFILYHLVSQLALIWKGNEIFEMVPDMNVCILPLFNLQRSVAKLGTIPGFVTVPGVLPPWAKYNASKILIKQLKFHQYQWCSKMEGHHSSVDNIIRQRYHFPVQHSLILISTHELPVWNVSSVE